MNKLLTKTSKIEHRTMRKRLPLWGYLAMPIIIIIVYQIMTPLLQSPQCFDLVGVFCMFGLIAMGIIVSGCVIIGLYGYGTYLDKKSAKRISSQYQYIVASPNTRDRIVDVLWGLLFFIIDVPISVFLFFEIMARLNYFQ